MEFLILVVVLIAIYLLYDGISEKAYVLSKEIELKAKEEQLKLQPNIRRVRDKTAQIIADQEGEWTTIEDINKLIENASSKE